MNPRGIVRTGSPGQLLSHGEVARSDVALHPLVRAVRRPCENDRNQRALGFAVGDRRPAARDALRRRPASAGEHLPAQMGTRRTRRASNSMRP